VKNTKRPLRVVLDDLTTAFVDAVLAAARGALTDRDSFFHAESAVKPRAARARPSPSRATGLRLRPQQQQQEQQRAPRATGLKPRRQTPSMPDAAVVEASAELLITDPQALLEALATAGPNDGAHPSRRIERGSGGEQERQLPRLLESANESNAQRSRPLESNAERSRPLESNAERSRPLESNAERSRPLESNAERSRPLESNAESSLTNEGREPPAPESLRAAGVPLLRAREGEEVLRSLGSSVVLRRRRA
jgi:hypothetical protein